MRISSSSNSGGSSGRGSWNCKSCTYANHEFMRECEICGASRYNTVVY